ncbi:MAG: sodium:proton antiporter [Chromatiales bacterium]|nr:sodium:proton antiporter [Chromatiales bacterium]
MDPLNLTALLVTVAALFAYLNHRFLRLPTTIGIMVISLALSVVLVLLNAAGLSDGQSLARRILSGLDFNDTLMNGMLSFLLFAGALHINLEDLLARKWVIGVLASIGVVVTTFLVGGTTWLLLEAFGLELPFIYCLVFGALIAPTDPIAVLGILKTAGADKGLETKIAGESLFNDGVAVVVFIVVAGIAASGQEPSAGHIVVLFLQEAVGGALFGLVAGWIVYRLLKSVNNYQVEILLTLALVMGGYALANALHLSGPLAVVVAGLLIGNRGRTLGMSETTREHLDTFWELVDEILNAVLFVLIGLEFILIPFNLNAALLGVLLALVVLAARFISVGIPIALMRLRERFHPHVVKILTWGGLRGGVSVALALSLPAGPERDLIVAVTYVIVVLSIIGQGLTIKPLVEMASRRVSGPAGH